MNHQGWWLTICSKNIVVIETTFITLFTPRLGLVLIFSSKKNLEKLVCKPQLLSSREQRLLYHSHLQQQLLLRLLNIYAKRDYRGIIWEQQDGFSWFLFREGMTVWKPHLKYGNEIESTEKKNVFVHCTLPIYWRDDIFIMKRSVLESRNSFYWCKISKSWGFISDFSNRFENWYAVPVAMQAWPKVNYAWGNLNWVHLRLPSLTETPAKFLSDMTVLILDLAPLGLRYLTLRYVPSKPSLHMHEHGICTSEQKMKDPEYSELVRFKRLRKTYLSIMDYTSKWQSLGCNLISNLAEYNPLIGGKFWINHILMNMIISYRHTSGGVDRLQNFILSGVGSTFLLLFLTPFTGVFLLQVLNANEITKISTLYVKHIFVYFGIEVDGS